MFTEMLFTFKQICLPLKYYYIQWLWHYYDRILMERYDLFMTWRETEKNVIFGKLK